MSDNFSKAGACGSIGRWAVVWQAHFLVAELAEAPVNDIY